MKTIVDHVAKYAEYHQDRRNVVTHFIGIPMIVLAVTTLLARPEINIASVAVTPAIVLAVLTCLFYLRLHLALGIVMTVFLGLAVWVGRHLASQSTPVWLSAGIGLFVLGWAIQFLGHHYERRKPAFLDDMTGLIIGPLFIVVEASFAVGLCPGLHAQVIERLRTAKGQSRPGTAGSSMR